MLGQNLDPACWQVGEVWCLCQKPAYNEPQTCKTGLKFCVQSVFILCMTSAVCTIDSRKNLLACFAPWITTLSGWIWNIKSHRIILWKWVNSTLQLTPTGLCLKLLWTCQPLKPHTTQSRVREGGGDLGMWRLWKISFRPY